jgi:Raf kinase inhibitor-like YbhB/YbcL family protein
MALTITSSAFAPGEKVPSKYTCEGDDLSPPLAFTGVPDGTKSLALIVDDPDVPDPKAPKRVWVHWVVYNLSPDSQGLSEDANRTGLPRGAVAGLNDWKRTPYGGPCPPIGRHRYFHKLYALDITLPAKPLSKSGLEAAMKGHVLAQAELIGTYQKGDPRLSATRHPLTDMRRLVSVAPWLDTPSPFIRLRAPASSRRL